MRRRILIVDDVATNRAILTGMLGDEYDIVEAADGAQALEICRREHLGLSAVLLDLVMPVMDGFELLSHLRENEELKQLPVIVTTGATDAESESKALLLGADDYVTKPYNPYIIRQRLHNAVNLREAAATVSALQRDKLTGLYNRETFFEQAQTLIDAEKAGHYVMSSFDIENFKVVNDQYGTAKGDAVLRYVASCIESWASRNGGICCRVTADNFAILYPSALIDSNGLVKNHAQVIRPPAISQPIAIKIGRYIIQDKSLSPSAIYDRASLAEASIRGRYDRYTADYRESMRERLLREQQIVTDMNDALRSGQFEPWFQPQYNHATGALVGAEALVRWRHPESGELIPPCDFVPVFERNGFIYEMDRYVWEQVCILLRRWIDEGRDPLPVSVNISRNDLFHSDFFESVTGLVEAHGIPLKLLRLEVTESAFSESPAQVVAMVRRLIDFGFTVEIDDFGSGYSSLNTLKDVPATILKLDMKFLEYSADSQRGGNILESIVRMAKWLDMSVIAEGVETLAQADFLKSIGCCYVQGYLYAKPMPAEEYSLLVEGATVEREMNALETVQTLDNNAFWDPNSMETLIFNSYVGGACIFEYSGGKGEILRTNDNFVRELGISMGADNKLTLLEPARYLDEENYDVMRANIEKAVRTEREEVCELCMSGISAGAKTYIRFAVRLLAKAGERRLCYGTVINVTAQRQAELYATKTAEQLQAVMDNINGGVSAVMVSDGQIKPIFANDKYYEQRGYTRGQYAQAQVESGELIFAEDRARVLELADEASRTGAPCSVVYRILRRDGTVRWVQNNISVMRLPEMDCPVQLSVTNDITEQRQAEQELRETDDQLRFLNAMAHDLLAQTDSEKGLERVMLNLCDYFGSARVCIFEFDKDKCVAYNTYAVCASGASGKRADLQDVPLEPLSALLDSFAAAGNAVIAGIDSADDSCADKRVLQALGARSLIAVPLMRDGDTIGFICVGDPSRQLPRVDRLNALGDYIAVMLTRRDMGNRINRDSEALRMLMADMPGGFCRLRLNADGTSNLLYANDGFCNLVGMSRRRVMELYGNDGAGGIHPDDTSIVSMAMRAGSDSDRLISVKYRLKCADGYKWVMVFGRIVVSDTGEKSLNAYYTDISAQAQVDDLRYSLIENLPCGAGIYELSGDILKAVYVNNWYRNYIGRAVGGMDDVAVTDVVHPDDRLMLTDALHRAIDGTGERACEVRVLRGSGDYVLLKVAGNIIERSSGKTVIYVTYTPVSGAELTMRQTVPVVLKAIMESSTDLAFAKDSEFTYICGTRAFAHLTGLENESELVGKTDYDLFPREIADKYRADDVQLMEQGHSLIDMVEQIPSDDGVPHYSCTSKYLLRDNNGSIVGLYGVGRDITGYRTAFEQLKLLTDSIPGGLGVFEVNAQSVRALYLSDDIYTISGYPRTGGGYSVDSEVLHHVFSEDLPVLLERLRAVNEHDTQTDCTYRIHTADGGYIWVNLRGSYAENRGDAVIINAALFDVTRAQEATERLRVSEEENRLALKHGGNIICRYVTADKSVRMSPEVAAVFGTPEQVNDVPYGPVKLGSISPETSQAYTDMYERILRGEKSGSACFMSDTAAGWRWFEANFSTIFNNAGVPVSAVLSFRDVTEQQEKEAVYKKWQQSLEEKETGDFTLLRCNLSRDASVDSVEGSLLSVEFGNGSASLAEQTADYVSRCVFAEDRDRYSSLMSPDTLLANYYRGRRTEVLEYREKLSEADVRWLRLSVELVEYPNSKDIEAYLMYENIDARKRAELLTRARAETDPLTGVMNRSAFVAAVEHEIALTSRGRQFAVLMMDIDGFKMVNDVFGHAAGDQTLIDIASALGSVLRRGDIVGRLGGDEFVVMLTDIPGDGIAAKKAGQICSLVRKSFSLDVHISASVGIAVCPRDGKDFDSLYRRMDAALYCVKSDGGNSFAFYREDMKPGQQPKAQQSRAAAAKRKRRMLIVDDNRIDLEFLSHTFKDDYVVERAVNGREALDCLRRLGTTVSVLLLDLVMPVMDGFEVLRQMRGNETLESIPVVVVTGDESPDSSLLAIRSGATDYVTKPADPDLLRLRVNSAVSRAENERLRAQNSYLLHQSDEVARYKTLLEHTGMALAEYDWAAGTFSYDGRMAACVAGSYDSRSLWQILAEDGVASPDDAGRLQMLVSEVSQERGRNGGSMTLSLKTPEGETHRFCVNVFKQAGEFRLTEKILISFIDTGLPPQDPDGK